MNLIPTHIVKLYEEARAECATLSITELGERRRNLETVNGILGFNNKAEYNRYRIRAIDDEIAQRTDGTKYDLYHRDGKVIR